MARNLRDTISSEPNAARDFTRTSASDDEVTAVDLIGDVGNPKLSSALRRCITEPEDPATWDGLEAITVTGSTQAEHVAEIYKTALERPLRTETLVDIGARALRFHDEWALPEESLIELLGRLLLIDPTVVWAFERLTLELTTRGRYAELLALYEHVLAAVKEGPRHVALLEEAADVARDCAGEIDRAIGYLDRLLSIDPRREPVAASLERLLGQRGRHRDLIAHWTKRMEVEGPTQTVPLRAKTARFCLETMNDPAGALSALEPVSPEEGGEEASNLLESIALAPFASAPTRRAAIDQLRVRYDGAGQGAELIPPLRALLAREGTDLVAVHGEIARRLVAEGRDDEALDDLAAILARDDGVADVSAVDRLLSDSFDGAIAGCRPTLDRGARLEIVRRAARLAVSLQGADERAIVLHRALLRELPSDAEVLVGLARLYAAGGRRVELLELRRHELGLAVDPEQRRALRLEIARLHLTIGDTPAAVAALRDNLDEQPGNPDVIRGAVATLEGHGQLAALAALLESHGDAVAEAAPDVAVGLWAKAADIAEHSLDDRARTIADHEKIVAISPEPFAFDALARLHTESGDHGVAVRWLQRLLAATDATSPTRTIDYLRLASAHLATGQPKEALACIEARVPADPTDMRLRTMQIDLRRARDDREGLVAALVDAAPHAEAELACAMLREGATLLTQELDAPARAVVLLERVIEIHPEVHTLSVLADTLYKAGMRERARDVGARALAEFGGRHPPERAGVHFLLGSVAHELGDDAEARRQLEAAVKTDMGNANAHLLLGRLCRAGGQLDRAERALHAALLLQRRGPDETMPPRAETLVELHRLAVARGDTVRASENLAAAFDAGARTPREARGLEQALRDAGMTEPLLSALDRHLAAASDPASQAAIHAERASALESLGRLDEAADAALRALALAPAEGRLHRRARAVCARAGCLDRYAESLEGRIASALESGDGVLGCALLLRLGDALENDLGHLDEAAAAYARAEDTSENILEVWRRRARLAERQGDRATRRLVLRKLAGSASDLDAKEQADTLYALADLELHADDSLDAGLSTLTLALECEARPEQAAKSLHAALDVASDREPIAKALESVARAHGDEAMLLEALWVATSLPRAPQSAFQEAYAIADRRSMRDRAGQLLERAVASAREAGDPGDALWALRLLTDDCERRGDHSAALEWASRAADAAPSDESIRFLARAAVFATALGDTERAVACYERLIADDPSDPDAWGSLLGALRTRGDAPRLLSALARAAEESRDPEHRNLLRMERARLLLADETTRADAKSALEAVLEEEPDHTEAADLLSGLLDPVDDRMELVSLLGRRLEIAQEAKDPSVAAIAIHLADVIPQADAVDVVRAALRVAPESPDLLRRWVGLLDPVVDAGERADAIERLLTVTDREGGSDERFSRTDAAAELVGARTAASDTDGVERAVGRLSDLAPDHPDVRPALAWLSRARIAEATDRPRDAARLLHAAAKLQDRLGDAGGALETLSRAWAAAPEDREILSLYTMRLLEGGRTDEAIAIASDAVERAAEPRERAARLAVRASLHGASGAHEAAADDLEAAQNEANGWLPELLAALDRARHAADEPSSQRALSLRQADVLKRMGRVDDARSLLADVSGDDPEMLRALLALDVLSERWEAAAFDGQRLLGATTGVAVAEVALTVAEALDRLGRPEPARAALERAHEADPSSGVALARLKELYVRSGKLRELAGRLFAEAQRTMDETRRFECLVEVGQLRLEKLGEAAAAIGPLSEALELRPEEPNATSLLVDALTEAGLIEDAAALLETAIARHGNRRSRELSELQRRMARVVGHRDRAAALRWSVLAFDTNPKSLEAASDLAELAVALQEYDVAVRALRALTVKTSEPEVRARAYVTQAEIAVHQGNPSRALVLARKAEAEAADLPEVKALLLQLGR